MPTKADKRGLAAPAISGKRAAVAEDLSTELPVDSFNDHQSRGPPHCHSLALTAETNAPSDDADVSSSIDLLERGDIAASPAPVKLRSDQAGVDCGVYLSSSASDDHQFQGVSPAASPAAVKVRAGDQVISDPVNHRSEELPLVASPGGNRDRFLAQSQPLKVCCDLSTVGLHNSSMRFSFQAIVLIVYPASDKPERRHVQLIDSRGSTGLTVWGPHVAMFSPSSIGQVVKFTKLSIIMHNGIRGLTMSRDSNINFVSDVASATEESKWWMSLLHAAPLRIIDVHDVSDNSVINVAGILGSMSTETKKVKSKDRDLLCMCLTDRTGCVDVRSWTHSEVEFNLFRERPLLLQRVRVTSFGGTKILEMLDASGTVVVSVFSGADDLKQYWRE